MSACREWTGSLTTRGYGYLYVKGKRWYAHRWVFLQENGYLPPVVRHSCDNPPCTEPSHLLAGTQAQNLQDTFDRGRASLSRPPRLVLGELRDLCQLALLKFEAGDHDGARALLTPADGFFFGGTEMDDYYKYCLEATIEQLTPLLDAPQDLEFSYRDSW